MAFETLTKIPKEMETSRCSLLLLATVVWLSLVLPASAVARSKQTSGLSPFFYASRCAKAEHFIRRIVFSAVFKDPGTAPGLVRLHFHDCFGNLRCDASVLLDKTSEGNSTEKQSIPNSTLRGLEVIDAAKAKLEKVCPGKVSCADILSYAARDAVHAAGGFWYPVSGGRRDGEVSRKADPLQNLPPPFFKVDQLTASFAKGGLSQSEMVTLAGAHTFGRSTICLNFQARIYNFSSTQEVDPSMDPKLALQLQKICPKSNPFTPAVVPLDPVTSNKFDQQYYKNLVNKQGLFTSDQQLFEDPRTKAQVQKYAADSRAFFHDFQAAFTRMAAIGVLTGTEGQIRSNCRLPNGLL